MALACRSIIPLQAFPLAFLLCVAGIDGTRIGVNWGDTARQPLPPEVVVELLRCNNITRVKLFDAKPAVLQALAGTGIEVMIAAPNNLLRHLAAPGTDGEMAATNWIAQNLTGFLQGPRTGGGVNIKYVAVGNEPFWAGNNRTYGHLALPALLNIQKAIKAAGLECKVWATIPFSADVLKDTPDPSSGAFRSDIAPLMAKIVASYNRTGAPFVMNMYPFLSLVWTPYFPPDYAFFGRRSKTDSLSNLTYHSTFDEMFDRTVSALERVGASGIPILVGEIGWPTDGNSMANTSAAQKFNNELLAHLASNSGTPLRPNVTIEVYLFSLVDENGKDLMNELAPFERHWGIFYQDGTPKYPIDLSGYGDSNSWPKAAVGVKRLPSKYCMLAPYFDPDPELLGKRIEFACSQSDCTALLDGSSCSGLNDSMKASYAFNNHYQFNYQEDSYCNYMTFGAVVTKDPSTEKCKFPLGLAYNHGSRRGLLIARNYTILTCLVFFLIRI